MQMIVLRYVILGVLSRSVSGAHLPYSGLYISANVDRVPLSFLGSYLLQSVLGLSCRHEPISFIPVATQAAPHPSLQGASSQALNSHG